ncbi:MAG: ABC transporter ATP-binding protein [Chloroflexota bacterium]|nr:MAG: ABC transporter ATP-binding protein [Chloroflexota bacterium]
MQIWIDNLHFTYPSGVEALRDVSLTLEPGEQAAIVGQNGAGKTTLVRHLNGLLQPTRGAVRIGDWLTHETSVAKLAARVGYVFQNPDDQLFKGNVRDEVKFGPTNLGLPPERIEAQVDEALALLDLTDKVEVNPYDLTPTWRKRVAIAAILAMDTPVIVLDEPTTGQDHRSVQHLAGLIRRLRERGKTVIAISHDIDFVAENFERIIVMGQGQVLLDGPAESVFAQEEILESTYVQPPQLARLASRLELGQVVYTAEGFLAAYHHKKISTRS